MVGRPKRVEKRATLQMREDGSLCVVVVADMYGNPHPRAAEHIRAIGPDAILHAGDIGDLRV